MKTAAPERCPRMLWVDGVGTFWLCLADEVTLGQPGSGVVDLPLAGDLARRHARIRRDGEGYLLEPLARVEVNGRPIARSVALDNHAEVRLGGLKMHFSRSHPLSNTARLEFDSVRRLHPSADAVLLLGNTCILGPSEAAHVVCRRWSDSVTLIHRDGKLTYRADTPLSVNDAPPSCARPLPEIARVVGDGLSFSLEPLLLE